MLECLKESWRNSHSPLSFFAQNCSGELPSSGHETLVGVVHYICYGCSPSPGLKLVGLDLSYSMVLVQSI